jgi:glycosyltransferase involved in cell wall biosynthesis
MALQGADFTVAIFSYNRGALLENCVTSCVKCFPRAAIVVYDDDSDDPETRKTLRQLSSEAVRIEASQYNGMGHDRHGALYRNMQRALMQCTTPYIIFLQDDMQFVRAVDVETLQVLAAAFLDPDIAFVRPQFFKKMDIGRFAHQFHKETVQGLIVPKDSFQRCHIDHCYCDVMIADVGKLRKVDWIFEDQERKNQILARRYFKYMPYLKAPLAFYCPEVPSYRDRKLYLASKIVQSQRNNELIRFHTLTDVEEVRLKSLSDGQLPVAEDFLRPSNDTVVRPFVFQDYSRSTGLRVLYKVESRLWRMWVSIGKFWEYCHKNP